MVSPRTRRAGGVAEVRTYVCISGVFYGVHKDGDLGLGGCICMMTGIFSVHMH